MFNKKTENSEKFYLIFKILCIMFFERGWRMKFMNEIKLNNVKLDDFKINFEEKMMTDEEKEMLGEMDTRLTITMKFVTKITCRGSCTCNCTAICFA